MCDNPRQQLGKVVTGRIKMGWVRSRELHRCLTGLALLCASALLPAISASAAGTGYTASAILTGVPETAVAVDSATGTVYVASETARQLSVISEASNTVTDTLTVNGVPRGLAVDPDTDTLYLSVENVNGETQDAVEAIDGATNQVTATIALPSGAAPAGVAVDSSTDTVYVADEGTATVTAIDGATDSVTATVSLGGASEPYGIAVDESSDVVWVAALSGAALAISGASDTLTQTISLASSTEPNPDPVSVAVDPATDAVYVGMEAQQLDVIDGATGSVTPISTTADTLAVTVDPATDTVYAADIGLFGYTWVIDGASDAITDTIDRGGFGAAADPSSGSVYEAAYSHYDGAWAITPSAANALSPVITSRPSATFTTSQAGSFTIEANALPAATFSETGALPDGVTFNSDGTVSGTPAADTGGAYFITVTASNGVAPDATQQFALTVDQPVVITSPSQATFTVGTTSSLPLTSTGYPPAVIFDAAGSLPSGVGFTDSPCCALSGDPAVGSGGVYSFTLQALDAGSNILAEETFTLTVDEAPTFTSAGNVTLRTGESASFLVTTDAYPGATITEYGKLPAGLTLDPGGYLWGTPGSHAGGVYHVTLSAANGIPPAGTQAFAVTVQQPPAFTSARSATFATGIRHTFTFTTSGYPTARLSERGGLPRGITFKAGRDGTAVLAGTPARTDKHRTYDITVTASNGVGGTIHETFRLKIT
jgi:large repetitive protein